jgi:tRNA-specific 2-thiouridylase
MANYNPLVIEHLVRPRNVGELEAPSGVGESGDAACGDVARFSIRIEENLLTEVRYKVYGCTACIAAGSALSELVRSRPLLEAARISKTYLKNSLGGALPAGKEHALTLVLDALHKALEDYWNKAGGAMLAEGYGGFAANGGKSVVAAMSGGVDSAVAALLLKEAGYDVATVTFRLHDGEKGSRSCCSPDTVLFARDTAHRMGLPHFTLDLKELFNRRVMQDFVGSYSAGRTPNPCVACNAHVKFHAASFLADRIGFRYVATGHYARVVEEPGGVTMSRPVDEGKDQTYVLWPVPKGLLTRAIFPLGEYRKEEVRHIAQEKGLAVAYTPESQDICFIPDGNYRSFIRKQVVAEPGEIVDTEGRALGQHAGVVDFTVGQRRGIGVSAPTPLYVTEVRPRTKQVVVGRREDLKVREVRVGGLNWFLDPLEAESVQVRYNGSPVPCEIENAGGGEVRALLSEPVMGVAPGQSAVFYKEDRVIGGGVVRRDTE